MEDSAIGSDNSVMVGEVSDMVGSEGRVGGISGTSEGFCCCSSGGFAAGGGGFIGGLFMGRFCCSKPLLINS